MARNKNIVNRNPEEIRWTQASISPDFTKPNEPQGKPERVEAILKKVASGHEDYTYEKCPTIPVFSISDPDDAEAKPLIFTLANRRLYVFKMVNAPLMRTTDAKFSEVLINLFKLTHPCDGMSPPKLTKFPNKDEQPEQWTVLYKFRSTMEKKIAELGMNPTHLRDPAQLKEVKNKLKSEALNRFKFNQHV